MQRPSLKAIIIGGLLVLSTLLSGCTTLRLTYNQAPRLSYWWLDSYVDFPAAQRDDARSRIALWFAWHRRTQLPDYAQFLAHTRTLVLAPEPLTAEAVCRWADEAMGRVPAAVSQALPLATEPVRHMSLAQLQHLQRKYDSTNAKYRNDYLQSDRAERLKAAIARTQERAESLYGKLNAAQKEHIGRATATSPQDPEAVLQERLARQRDTLQTLRHIITERSTPEQAQARLQSLAEQLLHSPREAYRAHQERVKQHHCALAAQVHNSAQRHQRQIAADRLKDWEDSLRALALQP